jgi:uncharacterized membrane-anchored protein
MLGSRHLLVVALVFQLRADRYAPATYWTAVTLSACSARW